MKKFDTMYDNMTGIYTELESIMGSIYEDLQSDPNNTKNANLLQGIGSVALKVLSSQKNLVEGYGDVDMKESLINNIDSKMTSLSTALEQSRNTKTR